jgi:hypothetical protein
MYENIRSLIQEHHAFYEVLPYYVVVGDAAATRRFRPALMLTFTAKA